MRLITHNLLRCNIKGLSDEQGYLKKIEAEKVEIITCDFNELMIKSMLRKLNWNTLKSGLTYINSLPSSFQSIESIASLDIDSIDEGLLREFHHVYFEVHIQDGFLVCPTTGRKFPIKDGIPNMLLHEDEV